VRGLAEQFDGDLLLGTVHFSEQGDYNSAALLSSHAKEARMYHKNHLVPFGNTFRCGKPFLFSHGSSATWCPATSIRDRIRGGL